MSLLSKIFLQLDYLNPFDDPADVVNMDDQISGSIDIAIAGLSIFLAVLAFSAYRKTKFGQLKFVVCAFSLFTVFLGIEAAEEFLPLNEDSFDLLLAIIILLILLCFFAGIMKKNSKKSRFRG